MNAAARRRVVDLGTVRELVFLAAGVALLAAGLLSRPRDAATMGIGSALLFGTTAVRAAAAGPDKDPGGGDG